MKKIRNLTITLSLLALLLSAGAPTVMAAKGAVCDRRVVPPYAKVYGKTYGEWSAKWWQWALGLPVDQNPFFDETGCTNGANGQSGPVWFLTGVFNETGTAVRDCVIPAGKALFFPILNSECSTIEDPPWYGEDEQQLRECAEIWQDKATDLACEIDGKPVANLEAYRVQSPLFEFTLPENNVWGMEPTTGQSVSDGVFLMVKPLPVGEHKIVFTGSIPEWNFTLHITYNLTVVAQQGHGRTK